VYFLACALVFAIAYLATSLTVTVGYHRGLAHRALAMHPITRFIVVKGGIWLTGLDPKTWVVMHRMHHAYSDTARDPHPPSPGGLLAMIKQEYVGATRTVRGLRVKERTYMRYAADLDFEVHPLLLHYMWWLPFVVHAIAGIVLGFTVGWLFGIAYYVGIASHPVTGALVNYFGHSSGGRNFDTSDDSRNNLLVAWFLLGEGFQNNHHRYPRSASFAYRRSEVDLGYLACLGLNALGLITINRRRLIPKG
jgi:fatty-acid desaturase